MEKAAIGIGSNLGDSVQTCIRAVEALRKNPGISILQASSLYRTKPVGFDDQGWFVNAAALCETALEPHVLLKTLLDLEQDFGRVRTLKWGPRTLDLDILYFGSRKIDEADLKVPHPLLQHRMFVLAPLAEIDPNWVHPGSGLSVLRMLRDLIAADTGQEIEKLDIRLCCAC